MHECTLKLFTYENETEEHIPLKFTSTELDLLNQYDSNCKRLKESKIFITGFPSLKNINWNENEGMSIKISDFDYSEVCELLHKARPIFLKKEPASFEKIQAIFGKQVKNTGLAKHLKGLRNLYEKGHYQPYFQFSVDNTPIFHNKTIMLWLNGVEYHQDAQKNEVVKKLEKVLSEDVARGLFVSHLSGRISAIFYLCKLVNKVLKEAK